MKVPIIIILISVIVLAFFFLPLWPKEVKSGITKVSTYTKIQLARGNLYMDKKAEDNSEELAIASKWSGIKLLPLWAKDASVEVNGNPATREFVITFSGNKNDIDAWLKNEPAFRQAEISSVSETETKYILKPQYGAGYAEVIINNSTNTVVVRVYWS